MIATLTEIVLILTAFQLVMLAVVLLTREDGKPLNRHLLAAFLLSKAFLTIRWLSFHFGLFAYEGSPYLYHLSGSAFFLLAPLLYLYVQSLCYRDYRPGIRTLVHAVPFLLMVLYEFLSVRVMLSDAAGGRTIYRELFVSLHGRIFWSANLLQILFYIAGMFSTVRAYRTELKERYSSVEQIDLNWLVMLLLVIVLHWLFVASRSTLSLLEIQAPTLTGVLDLFSITIFLGFTTVLVFRGLQQLRVFEGVERQPRYLTSKLTEERIREHARTLEQYMEAEKPYLDASLTLEELSQRLSLESWDLSRVINTSFGQNFFNFVNGFRIQEAQRLLSDSSNGRRTIHQVVFDVGFNSRSVFNAAFKKQTGMTPSEFKRNRPGSADVSFIHSAFVPHKKRPAL
jgi:AraC-like DNA-binding protein